jgi:hypothetical protein
MYEKWKEFQFKYLIAPGFQCSVYAIFYHKRQRIVVCISLSILNLHVYLCDCKLLVSSPSF